MNVNDNEKDTKVEKEIPTDLAKWARALREESNTDALEAKYDDFAEQYDKLYDNGYRDIHGVDMSAGSLKVLEKKQIYSKLVKARFDPSTPLQYADGYFDVIISAGVFVPCHLTHACLPEIIRLLKAGGHILITTRKNVFDEEMAGIKLKSSFASLTKDGVLEKISHEEIGYATENDEVTPGLILSYKVLQQ
ncbi:uncharacterized protein LOC115920729 isoform X2 [Strongylocentrotus purpuratus]|uniref:Methyltransferase type 11 domain-containing protein n=1 Tax=Strongylocentrotus purpuratus TaxID=7668 RepID=A0A7M7SUZ1_STRPU|nr:uncharacterized protein LOC115920729 isoform X2 [Strongylocentrotus purpuratus]